MTLAQLRSVLSRLHVALGAIAAWVPAGVARWTSLLSLGFLLAALLGHGRAVLALAPDAQGWLWLLLGVGLSLLSLVGSALLWGLVLQWLGQRPRWQPLVLAYLSSNVRKYLPGGIWHLATRLQWLRGQGHPHGGPLLAPGQPLPVSQALMAVLLDPLVAAVAALALVSCGGWQGGLGGVALLPLLLLWPRWLTPVLAWIERRKAAALGVEPSAPQLPAACPWAALGSAFVFVLLRFGGFACCVMALDLQSSLGWGGWLAGFALAWTAGLVVPGAPAGLGVFEVVLLLRLGEALPEPPLLALAISYRLVVSLADVVAVSTAAADQRRKGLAALRN